MISRNQSKYIRSLETKKGRMRATAFVAEGPKVVSDLLTVAKPIMIAATAEWYAQNDMEPQGKDVVVTPAELQKLSFLQHPQHVLAVFPIAVDDEEVHIMPDELYLALDGVQDPGNLGTIVRIADWFGITRIFCSRDTADVYNPKVVQATMGSLARVSCTYTDLASLLSSLSPNVPIFGTFLDGENIYQEKLPNAGFIVMGNEGNGISSEIAALINHRLLIPNFPSCRATADSLNVAVATAIACYEFRRQG